MHYIGELKRLMYGYLRYKIRNKPDKISRMYKCYYCSLCHALKKNYGIFATALLSYDLVFAAISLSSANNFADNKPKCCLYKRKKKLDDEYSSNYWKCLATASIALAYSKALDNYLDKPNLLSKIIFNIFTLFSRKARKKNPDIFTYLDKAMRMVKQAEEQDCGFEVQSSLSAEMISSALCDYGDIKFDSCNKIFLNAVAKWLCFVDAIDDYEKDRKKKSYNPLYSLMGKNNDRYQYEFNYLIQNNYIDIAKIYFKIFKQMNDSLKEIQINTNEKIFLEDMVNRVMPQKIGYIFLSN